MTKRTQLIGRSPRMEQVINLVSRPEFMRILESAYEPERNTFTDRRGGYGGGGGNSEYNGYFKITDASKRDDSGEITQTRVAIIDGGLGSSSMPCRVNNSVFYVPSKNDMEVSGNETVILLKFDADTKTFSYEAKDSLPSDTQNTVYYQIGRVKVKDNRLVIQQDHTTGVIQLWWFRICQEEEIQ